MAVGVRRERSPATHPVELDRERQGELPVRAAHAVSPHHDRGLPAAHDGARRRGGVAACEDFPDDGRVHRGRPEGVAGERRGEQQRRVTQLLCRPRRRLGRVPPAAADDVHHVLEDGVAGARGLLRSLQVFSNALGRLDAVAPQDRAGLVKGRRIGRGEAARDRGWLVAHHVGEQEGCGRGRGGQPDEPAALQHRDVLSDGVDLPDVGPALEESPGERLEIRKLDRRLRVGQQRRGPPGDEGEEQLALS